MSDAVVAIEPLEMPTASPVADVVSAGRAARAAGASEETAETPPPLPAPAERAPEMEAQSDGTPLYKVRLLDLLLELLARLSPTEADALREIDIDDAIAEARRDLLARERFSAGLELGTGLVVDMVA